MPWINGRCLINGLPTLPPFRNLDTYRIARKSYNLNSYKLDYLAKVLGVRAEGKLHTSYQLWLDVMNKDENAYNHMINYNIMDVHLLREVYKKLRPGMSGIVWANMVNSEHDDCVNCGHSGPHTKRGTVPNLKTHYRRYTCKKCGCWMRGPNIKGLPNA